ncbi:MAG: hypothetical protein F4Y44_06485 [Chloroflexi bacterium]|nr:hypothetical protein [Chloroflexota bacterium]
MALAQGESISVIRKTLTQVRRNHALEHATVSLMIEEGVRGPLGGYSLPWGFFIVGNLSTEQLERIVDTARRSLNAGNSEMAISPHCGTNIALATLFSGILSRLALGKSNRLSWKRLPLVLGAVVVGALLSRPIGNAVQRHFTTLPDIGALEVVSVRKAWPGDQPRLHRVFTQMP